MSYKLPAEMKIYNVLTKLTLFIPKPMLCKNCCKFGHLAKFCKNPKICQKCSSSDQEHADPCELDPKCNSCLINKDHVTNSPDCPEKKFKGTLKK